MCVLYGGVFPPIYGRTEEQAAKNHCGISGLWDGVCGGGSAFHFRLAVHGDCDLPVDGRRQMAVHGKELLLIHISEPTSQAETSDAVFCL